MIPMSSSPPKEDDSDDESDEDFKRVYRLNADSYEDLSRLASKPLFITDLIQGLQSDDYKRFTTAV
jgi:hypothetical protein